MKNPTAEQRKRWNKAYYEKNKKKRYEQYNKYRKELRVWFEEIKSVLKCELCGFDHPAALHFHHQNPEEKVAPVSRMVGEGWSKDTILKEIEKCDVLCANCHAILHYEERNQ